ncbi:hypothetical protein [Haliea sp. E17]|uniref:hypothetical protein n=1 Tax=Haliea sp. E17 TaxID=3401576 RepID=UPI003AAAE0B5
MTAAPPGTLSGHQFRQRFDEARHIVDDYARFLAQSGPMPGQVMDASLLPHPKHRIRSAVLLCLNCNLDPVLGEHLEAGYLLLSAFQDGVGPRAVGEVFAHLELEADPHAIDAILKREYQAADPFRNRARQELQELHRDLESLRRAIAPASH